MIRRFRVAPPVLLAAALVPLLALSACTPAPEEGFEEEQPAATAADADTGAGSAIETETAQAEIGDTPEAAAPPTEVPGETPLGIHASQQCRVCHEPPSLVVDDPSLATGGIGKCSFHPCG